MRELIVDLNNRGAVKAIQRGLNVEVDGHWGPITQRAWNAHTAQLPRPHLFDVPLDWLPMARMQRIIVHWTGGTYRASDVDKMHYHILVEGDGTTIRGNHPISANETIAGKSSHQYAAHVASLNTGSIGVGLCSMAGAKESPLDYGRYPITKHQWDRACEVVAVLCDRYTIPVSRKTVLTHAEVEPNLGVPQAGKWDITVLEFTTVRGAKPIGEMMRGAIAIGEMMREEVRDDLARMRR